MSEPKIQLKISTYHDDGSISTEHWPLAPEAADMLRGQLGAPRAETMISAEGRSEIARQDLASRVDQHITLVRHPGCAKDGEVAGGAA